MTKTYCFYDFIVTYLIIFTLDYPDITISLVYNIVCLDFSSKNEKKWPQWILTISGIFIHRLILKLHSQEKHSQRSVYQYFISYIFCMSVSIIFLSFRNRNILYEIHVFIACVQYGIFDIRTECIEYGCISTWFKEIVLLQKIMLCLKCKAIKLLATSFFQIWSVISWCQWSVWFYGNGKSG